MVSHLWRITLTSYLYRRLLTCHKGTLRNTWLSGLEIFLAALLSVLVGVVFSTRPEHPPLYTHERFGFMFVLLVVASLPQVYRTIARGNN